jgi:hypothetical protein
VKANPMDRRPPPCKCGEAQAARQDEIDNAGNPRCHLCRVVAVDHPEYSPAEVAREGARRWRAIVVVAAKRPAA